MRLIIPGADSNTTSINTVITEHNGREISWDCRVFDRTRTNEDVFLDINAFWQRQSIEVQERIFDVYEQIRECFTSVHDDFRLTTRLTELVGELYSFHSLADVGHYVSFYANVKIPSDVQDNYSEDFSDQNYRDRTYLTTDYKGLVLLCVMLRPMTPIWGEYIARIKGQTGNNFKEKAAYKLLARTEIVRSPQIQQLLTFAEVTAEFSGQANHGAAIHGLPNIERPEWLLSMVVVRKLVMGEIRDEGVNLIRIIYNYITSQLKGLDGKLGGRVKSKERRETEREDNTSHAENYKTKQLVADGKLIPPKVYCENPMQVANDIDPTVDLVLVKTCVDNALKKLQRGEICQHHIRFVQCVMRSVISARGVDNSVGMHELLMCMGVSQALLIHWGFGDLAVLVTAQPEENENRIALGGIETRSRINRETMDQLVKMYPHYVRGNKSDNERSANVALRSIDGITLSLMQSNWKVVVPGELATKLKVTNGKLFEVPADIRQQLASLNIKMGRDQHV